MRAWIGCLMAAGLMLAAVAGCEDLSVTKSDANDQWLVNQMNDDMIHNAILTQHALFPYHFMPNSATLNDLGKHDLVVLAGYYKEHPGAIVVSQGTVSDELYKARMDTVVQGLTQAGVQMARVKVGDGLPGGDGVDSNRAVLILQVEADAMSAGKTKGTGTSTETTMTPSNPPGGQQP